MESDSKMRDKLQKQYKLLPKLEELVTTHISGKYMKALVFLLHKASEVTRTFNKKKSGNRARERVKLLDELNSVHQNPNSTIHDIEEVGKKLTSFDEEDIRKVPLKNENFRMFDDER